MSKKKKDYTIAKIDMITRFILTFEEMVAKFGFEIDDLEKRFGVMKKLRY